MVARYSLPFQAATPRLTTSQQALTRPFARHLRVVVPQLLAALRVEGVDLAPGRGHVDATIDDQRRGFLPAPRVEVRDTRPAPAAPTLPVLILVERTEALLAVVAAMAHPLAGIGRIVCGQQARARRPARRGRGLRCGACPSLRAASQQRHGNTRTAEPVFGTSLRPPESIQCAYSGPCRHDPPRRASRNYAHVLRTRPHAARPALQSLQVLRRAAAHRLDLHHQPRWA